MILKSNKETGGALVLTVLSDTLDISNAIAFRGECTPLIESSEGNISLNCEALKFIDSSGVGALLHINKLLPTERRPVRLTGVGPKVLALLELMHVHRSFKLESDA
jgi:anti-sigma B factor antagonist